MSFPALTNAGNDRIIQQSQGRVNAVSRLTGLMLLGLMVSGLVYWTGCSSSGTNPTTAGASLDSAVASSPAARQLNRTRNLAEKVNPGYLRYMVRLAERRAERGLPAPPDLRIAERRVRYQETFSLLKATRSVLETVNPIPRPVPFQPSTMGDALLNPLSYTDPTAQAAASILLRP